MAHVNRNRDALLARVGRIAGQVSAVERNLKSDADCAALLQLVAAVRGAINGLMDEIIVDHLDAHVVAGDLTADERRQGADELVTVIRRYNK